MTSTMLPLAGASAPLLSLCICVSSAVLESVLAGSGIRRRLAELPRCRLTPPLWAWICIGVGYYTICFVLLWRLFSPAAASPPSTAALALLVGLMGANAAWNWFFFRTRNLKHAFAIGLVYSLAAVALFVVLLPVDRLAAWLLSPYLAYLLYANAWGYRLMRLHR